MLTLKTKRQKADKMKAIINKIKIPDTANTTPLEKLPFHLQNKEKIIRELKPQFFGYMVTRGFGGYVGLLSIIILAISAGLILLSGLLAGLLDSILLIKVSESLIVWITIIPVTIFLIISIKPFISYGKSWYWITNQRVIGKRGFLGYSIDSIPLDNVSDVVIIRTLLDRFLGLSSLIIVPKAASSRARGGSANEDYENPNLFPALSQNMAMELQRVLFNLRDDLRKSHNNELVAATSADGVFLSSEAAQPESNFPRGIR